MKVVKFKYYDEFQCIGPECPDTCCQGWTIFFGKREYLDYKKADCSQKLKDVISGSFVRVRDHEKKGISYDERTNYAEIRLKENGDCPFHDSDGLCMVQKELGEKALSYVCSTFPRLQGSVGGENMIYACNLTCPHVIDVLMDHPEGLEIVEEDYDGSCDAINKGMHSLRSTPKSWFGYPYYWIIKSAQLDILQNRSFTIPERLLILGFFCKKADEYIEANQGEKIEGLYNMLLDPEFCRKVAESLKAPQSDENALAKSVGIFSKMLSYARESSAPKGFKDCFEKAAGSIDLDIKLKLESDGQGQVESTCNKEKYFKNVGIFRGIESDRPYILENVFVNLAFTQTPDNGIFKNFFVLAMFYNILKISIPAFLEENWTDKDLAMAITGSAKMIINSHIVEDGLFHTFIDTDSFDLPHAAFLIS